MAAFVMLNNFLHDFSAAWWMVCAILLRYSLARRAFDNRDSVSVLAFLCNSMLASLAGIVVFGAVRLWAYRRFEWIEAAGVNQVKVLAVKHVLFAAAVVFGLLQLRRARGILKQARRALTTPEA